MRTSPPSIFDKKCYGFSSAQNIFSHFEPPPKATLLERAPLKLILHTRGIQKKKLSFLKILFYRGNFRISVKSFNSIPPEALNLFPENGSLKKQMTMSGLSLPPKS